MMTLGRLALPTNRSAAARTLKVSTRSHRVPIALTRRTSVLRMPPSKRKAAGKLNIKEAPHVKEARHGRDRRQKPMKLRPARASGV